jgi:hypothetical protein
MNIVVVTYLLYLAISVGLTIWVALHKNGRIFLVDVFTAMNHSPTQSITCWCYLINLGFVSMALKLGYDISTREGIEALSVKSAP